MHFIENSSGAVPMQLPRSPATIPRSQTEALTGIRGIAAFYVVLYHFFSSIFGLGILQIVLKRGYLAVDMFFVLSGFVIALNYQDIFEHNRPVLNYARFLWVRFARIYPLYIVVLGLSLAVILTRSGTDGLSAASSFSNILMMQQLGIATSIDGVAWSISTEFITYAIFPLLLIVCRGGSVTKGLVAILAVAGLFYVSQQTGIDLQQIVRGSAYKNGPLDAADGRTLFPLLRCICGFTLGMLAFFVASDKRLTRLFSGGYRCPVLGLLVLIALSLPGQDVLVVFVFAVFVTSIPADATLLTRILSRNPILWVGEISYSIYLIHGFLYQYVRPDIRALLDSHGINHAFTVSGVIILVLVAVVSPLTFYGIEKPGRRWLRSIWGLRQPPLVQDPAAP